MAPIAKTGQEIDDVVGVVAEGLRPFPQHLHEDDRTVALDRAAAAFEHHKLRPLHIALDEVEAVDAVRCVESVERFEAADDLFVVLGPMQASLLGRRQPGERRAEADRKSTSLNSST